MSGKVNWCLLLKIVYLFFYLHMHAFFIHAFIHTPLYTHIHAFFLSNTFFQLSLTCLTFPWIKLQMLLRCCLIHITIIILVSILYVVHSCPCLGLGLFMPYLCHRFFAFSLTFIGIKGALSGLKQFSVTESRLKVIKETLFISPQKLFSFSRYLSFSLHVLKRLD